MKACVAAFGVQKAGNVESEYEDSFWPCTPGNEAFPVRIAAADGATDAVYSGIWARLLVRSWGKRRLDEGRFLEGVDRDAKLWRRIIRHRKMPWYVEQKAQAGTFAAFVGLELDYPQESGAGTWSAVACGDCCFFHIRGRELLKSFPLSRSTDFSNCPHLVSSNQTDSKESEGLSRASGAWEDGDSLYLMSDALACWFLTRCEAGFVPWQILTEVTLTGEPSFANWIDELRKRNEIKNDDCTLVSVTFE